VLFYDFLLKIGLSPAKSKTISELAIPNGYFFDFLRGYFDGDGCSYSYWDRVFPNSYRFYISFASGSEKYILWLQGRLKEYLSIIGHISRKRGSTDIQLRYSKREAGILAEKMYHRVTFPYLERKRRKIFRSLNEME